MLLKDGQTAPMSRALVQAPAQPAKLNKCADRPLVPHPASQVSLKVSIYSVLNMLLNDGQTGAPVPGALIQAPAQPAKSNKLKWLQSYLDISDIAHSDKPVTMPSASIPKWATECNPTSFLSACAFFVRLLD